MIISYITLLPIDNAQADAVGFRIAINPAPVRLSVIELDVFAIKKQMYQMILIL